MIPHTPQKEYTPNQGFIMQSLINTIYECDNTEELVRYYDAAFFSPTKHRMLTVEKHGYFRGCPGITRKAINKHLGIEAATEQGWMKQHRQHPRSSSTTTSITTKAFEDDSEDECTTIPQQEPDNAKTHEVYFKATEAGSGLIYNNQTEKSPRTSNQGYNYLAIFYIYDAKYLYPWLDVRGNFPVWSL